MDADVVDTQLRRFARTGDPRALAAVYDRTAQELLLVAAHLGSRAGDAEDLVQATFLAVIERIDDYDQTRPALPWLLGILANRARRMRRDRQRQIDPGRVRGGEPANPLDVATDAELAHELAQCLRGLPPGYREVMNLRWVHGLMPMQIAHALGLPPDTVKTRLRRGADLLRQALPVGLAGSIVAALRAGTVLAGVRKVVIAAARERALLQGAVAPAAWGWTVLAVGTGALALAAALLWWASGSEGGRVVNAPSAPHATAAPPASPAAGRSEPLPAATAGDAAKEPRRELAGDVGEVRIRVRYFAGEPAAGVHVAATPRMGGDPLLRRQWVCTDAEGTARLSLAPGVYALAVDRGGDGEVTLTAGARAATTLTIPAGVDLEGRVVDGEAPVAGAGVWLSFDDRPDEGHVVTTTEASGRFALRGVSVDRMFSVLAAGCIARPLQRIEGPLGCTHELEIDVRSLRSNITLTGRVVDQDDQPIAGAHLQLGRRLAYLAAANAGMGPYARVPPVQLTADAEGRFTHTGLVVHERALEVWARAPGHATATATVTFSKETRREVTLRLSRGVVVRGSIRTPQGNPAPSVVVTARDESVTDWSYAPRWAECSTTSDGNGDFELRGPAPGRIVLNATSAHGERATDVVAILAEHAWNPTLTPRSAIHGVLADERGAPLAGLHVRALVARGRLEPKPALSDEAGSFALADCDPAPHALWITDPRSPWSGAVASRAGVRAGQEGLRVVIPRADLGSGGIIGRVVDARGVPQRSKVALGHLRVGRAFTTTDAEGRFRFAPLAAGLGWNVEVQDDARRWGVKDGLEVPAAGDVDAGDFVLMAPGKLVVQVEGTPSTDGDAAVHVALASGLGLTSFALHAGRGESEPLPPGDYLVHVRSATLPQSPAAVAIRSGETTTLPLRFGAVAARSFTFSHPDDGWDLRLELRWLDAQDRLLCVDRVQWPHERGFALQQAFAPGTYRLHALAHSRRIARVEFEAAPGPEAVPVHVELR